MVSHRSLTPPGNLLAALMRRATSSTDQSFVGVLVEDAVVVEDGALVVVVVVISLVFFVTVSTHNKIQTGNALMSMKSYTTLNVLAIPRRASPGKNEKKRLTSAELSKALRVGQPIPNEFLCLGFKDLLFILVAGLGNTQSYNNSFQIFKGQLIQHCFQLREVYLQC